MAGNVINLFKLWTQSDQVSERKLQKILEVGLDEIVQQESDALQKIKTGRVLSGPVNRWMEEKAYPFQLTGQQTTAAGTTTMTVSGKLFGADVDEEKIKNVLRVGTILERESDGEQFKVTSISGIADPGPYTCVVEAYSDSSQSDDGSPTDYTIISELWSDYTDAGDGRGLDRGFREVGTQILAEVFEIPKTMMNTGYENVANEFEHQVTALLTKLRMHLAYSCIRGKPQYVGGAPAYANQVQDSHMIGLVQWLKENYNETGNDAVYVNGGGNEPDKDKLDDMIRHMYIDCFSNFQKGDWWIYCDPVTHQYIQSWDVTYRRTTQDTTKVGFEVDVFQAKIGKTFPILWDRYQRPGTLMVVDFSQPTRGWYKNDEMDRQELPVQGRYKRWLISQQAWGVMLRKPIQSIGGIYNLARS